MLWIYSVLVDGEEVLLEDVRADVQIHHGRDAVFGDPAASTCQIVILEASHSFVQAFRVGVDLVVIAMDEADLPPIGFPPDGRFMRPRFAGRITDATLDVDTLTAIGAGRLSTLSQYPIALAGWPAEYWVDRLLRVFAEAGLSSFLDLHFSYSFNPILASRPVTDGPTTLGDYLPALAAMIGAAVTDYPVMGPQPSTDVIAKIRVEVIGDRSFSSPTLIAPADVAYAPVWSQVLPAANIVTVSYTGAEGFTRTGNLTDNSPVVTGLTITTGLTPGMAVRGMGIQLDTKIATVDSGSQFTMTKPANIAADKDGTFHPGETKITEVSDTSDLSVGMTVEKPGDLQTGTKIIALESQNEVTISLPAIGTHQGNIHYTAPSLCSITFAAEMESVTVRDEASISLYGERAASIDTTFLYESDATRRANERLLRASQPRWNIPAAPILRGLELETGEPVTLSSLPPSSPITEWLAMLEGYAETITGDEWTMELALSDPLLSGFVLSWPEIPTSWAWNELDPAASWFDAISVEAITP